MSYIVRYGRGMLMISESIDAGGLEVTSLETGLGLTTFKNSFESKVSASDGVYQNFNRTDETALSRIVGVDESAMVRILPEAMQSARTMLEGVEVNGTKTLGLIELSRRKLNPEYFTQNLKQQSGFAAEIISTWKENLVAKAENTGITTMRADDLPERFSKNDQLVDKVRLDSTGKIIETIQTKFVGKNGSDWLSKAMSSRWDKYFNGGVDKLECPKDYYEEVMAAIPEKEAYLKRQLDRVVSDGKSDVAESISRRIDKLDQLKGMVEQSTVTSDEAQFARLHPKAYVAKTFGSAVAKVSNIEGVKTGGLAAALTLATSSVENVSAFLDGEISAEKMVVDTVGDTVVAGAIGYGSTFVGSSVSAVMGKSSCALISKVGGTCAPAAVIAFAVESYGDISDFAQGKIEAGELAYNLGENAAGVAGGLAGGAMMGAAVGAVAGPGGALVGGVVGGVVGTVVATEAYATAVEMGSEGVEILGDKVQELANDTIDAVSECVPEQLDEAKAAFNDFFSSNSLPFSV